MKYLGILKEEWMRIERSGRSVADKLPTSVKVDNGRNSEEEWILSREDSDCRECRLQSLGVQWMLNRE